ncbi:type I restriction enzyme S subunit [Rhodococcus sp. LBL1]|nr:type I restriction enzyme S subunit [Rhodococcus sp. LBL1]MDH6686332.1 type I restriction enzyme S subunit [Rhodococcus sp. LBL2]
MTTVALGEIVDFYSGGTPSKAQIEFWDGDVPWFSAKDMKRPRLTDSIDHISDAVFSSTSLRKLPAGTVAIVVRGMILAHTVPIAILDVDAAINQDLKALLPRRDVDPSFLAAMLRAQHTKILAQVSTAAHGTKKLESRVLEGIRIPLPSLDEQRRIASILDQTDALRAKRRQIVAHLDALTRSIFHEMFGRQGSHLENAATISLGEVLSLKSGSFLPAKAQEGGPYPVFGGNGVNGHHSKYMFEGPKLVIGRVGAYCGAVHLTPPKSWITDNALYVSEVKREVSLGYLRDALITANLNQFASQSGQPLISGSRIKDVPLTLPSVEAQALYERRVSNVADRRAAEMRGSALDDELFVSLQSRAFRGEL